MNAPSPSLVHDAVAERCGLAGNYTAAAASLAQAGDTVGMVRALGAAARVILSAVEAAESLRPSNDGGRA